MLDFNLDSYNHPLTSRYLDEDMAGIFSESAIRRRWRECWAALAAAQHEVGDLVPAIDLKIIEYHVGSVDIARSLAAEKYTKHDLVAELQVFAGQCGPAGKLIHLGATSSDITENANHVAVGAATRLIRDDISRLSDRLYTLQVGIKPIVTTGYTHLQPANPTSWSFRILAWREELEQILATLVDNQPLAKGFKGPVGNRATYAMAYKAKAHTEISWQEAHRLAQEMDLSACKILGIRSSSHSTQIPFRHGEYMRLAALSSLAAWLHKVNQDIRLLYGLGEIGIKKSNMKQVGSSAMAWKINPIEQENVCSLVRTIPEMLQRLWGNRANSWLERSLDDSANSRSLWPDVFITLRYCLKKTRLSLDNLTFPNKLPHDDHIDQSALQMLTQLGLESQYTRMEMAQLLLDATSST